MAPDASSMPDREVRIEEQQQKSSKAVGWSDLHPELLAEIFRCLDVGDYIRCLAVCASWRSIPERSMNFCKPNRDRQLPWLLIPSRHDKPGHRSFDGISCFRTEMAKHTLHLSRTAYSRCIGSSQGFLITVEDYGKCCALNPLTGAVFPLPPTATHPDLLLHDESRPDAPPRLIIPKDCTDVLTWYRKAVISPSLDTIAVATRCSANDRWAIRDFRNLAYARVGNDSWTALVPPWRDRRENIDFIFHKGGLYALYSNGYLVIFNLENPADLPLVSSSPGPIACHCLLTETPDSENLLLLRPSLTNIAVFRLDKSKLEWNQVQSIGDVALFNDGAYVSSLSTRGFPCLKSNSVYSIWPENTVKQIGVYDLEDGSVHPLSSDDKLGEFCLPESYCVWFTPAI